MKRPPPSPAVPAPVPAPPPELPVLFAPVELPEAFPCAASRLYRQADRPITLLHFHHCLELGLCHSGTGIFMVDRKVLPFRGGDVSVITSREVHLARSAAGTVSEWTWVNLDPVRLLGPSISSPELLSTAGLAGPDFANVVSPEADPALAGLLRLVIRELETREDDWMSAVRGLVWTILARLQRLPGARHSRAAGAGADAGPEPQALERIAPVLHTMLTRFHEELSMPGLAAMCHMSPATFRRAFHAATGMPPLAYLSRLRLQMAKAMLAGGDMPVGAIARTVGYPTVSSFNRQFLRLAGMAPAAWRRHAPVPASPLPNRNATAPSDGKALSKAGAGSKS